MSEHKDSQLQDSELKPDQESSSPESTEEAQAAGVTKATDDTEDWGAQAQSDSEMNFLKSLIEKATKLTLGEEEPEVKLKVLEEVSFQGIAQYIIQKKAKNIVVLTGAGISTSAGIPDFRSPESGLYDNLQKYNLPNPQAIFEIGYFKENPEPFFTLAKELYPGSFKPTICHYFIKLLSDKNLLLRNYTQNVDSLERIAGVPGDKMVEAHGTFHTGHCLGECRREYTHEWMRDEIFQDRIPKCPDCDGVVKPDIVFFGEALPFKFFSLTQKDFPKCDLLLVMGTSLVVQPFASLVNRVPEDCPRLLINREKSGQVDPLMQMLGFGRGMDFDSPNNYRDVAFEGTCDDGCVRLAELLGWKDELLNLVETEHARIDAEKKKKKDEATKTNKTGKAATSDTTPKAETKLNNPDIPSEKL